MVANRARVGYRCNVGSMGRIERHPYEIAMQIVAASQNRIGAVALPEMWVNGQLG